MKNFTEYIKNLRLKRREVAVSYLGQEGFLIKSENRFILIDGYLTDYVDKHCNTDVIKWVRRYPAPIKPEELDFVDVVMCTHSHYDHADPDTIKGILSVNEKAVFIAPVPEIGLFEIYGVPKDRIIGASVYKKFDFGFMQVEPIAAAHEEFHIENGEYKELSYLITIGDKKIFHAGDSLDCEGLAEKMFSVDLALLPINGRDEFRAKNDIIGNMTICEAINLAIRAKVKMMIPMHYDLYDVNCAEESEYIKAIENSEYKGKYNLMQPAETVII